MVGYHQNADPLCATAEIQSQIQKEKDPFSIKSSPSSKPQWFEVSPPWLLSFYLLSDTPRHSHLADLTTSRSIDWLALPCGLGWAMVATRLVDLDRPGTYQMLQGLESSLPIP